MIVPAYPGRVVPLKIFMARKFDFLGVKFWSRNFFKFWFLPPFNHPCHLKSGVYNLPWNFVEHTLENILYFRMQVCLSAFSSSRPFYLVCFVFPDHMMVPQGTVSLKMLSCTEHRCTYVCIIYKNAKGKFPGEHHVVWMGQNIQAKEVYR